MDANRVKRNELLAKKVIKNLESRNMEGYYAKTCEEALEKALSLIPKGSSIGWGGSASAKEIGLTEAIINGEYEVHNREAAKDGEEKGRIEREIFSCDYFFCGTNAMTEGGELVNIDGYGNRVAALIYGPKNVVLIVGMNKVCKDLESAMKRARNEAAPINAQRFSLNTPCNKEGSCYDCKVEDTICCQFVITRYSKIKNRIKVILVDDFLGF